MVFGMAFEYVAPGERLPDLGIGTGLSSAPFRKAGPEIRGLDGSEEMLAACRRKG
jgi:predicted TPR repeat methyltransferase